MVKNNNESRTFLLNPTDQVVLHMLNKNDLVVCLDAPVGEDRVGELAAVLATVRG